MSTLPLYLITGLSGAGKSHAIQAFEDMGFYCVDNLPTEMLGQFLSHCTEKKRDKSGIALVLDVREGDFVEDFPEIISSLDTDEITLKTLFLEASSETLLNRYKESRRPHPLGRNRSLEEAIETERRRLTPVRERADLVIDTSEITTHQFRGLLTDLHHPDSTSSFTLSLTSFGFKHGVPAHVDSLFDARFLPNPYYEPELQSLTGSDDAVAEYLRESEPTSEYLEHLKNVLELMIDAYSEEGKTLLSVGIGCTGGRHRSVFLVQELASHFDDAGICRSVVTHRDLRKHQSKP
ncbi:MAG: RNase adapter RapZ, partial [bacterium]